MTYEVNMLKLGYTVVRLSFLMLVKSRLKIKIELIDKFESRGRQENKVYM